MDFEPIIEVSQETRAWTRSVCGAANEGPGTLFVISVGYEQGGNRNVTSIFLCQEHLEDLNSQLSLVSAFMPDLIQQEGDAR